MNAEYVLSLIPNLLAEHAIAFRCLVGLCVYVNNLFVLRSMKRRCKSMTYLMRMCAKQRSRKTATRVRDCSLSCSRCSQRLLNLLPFPARRILEGGQAEYLEQKPQNTRCSFHERRLRVSLSCNHGVLGRCVWWLTTASLWTHSSHSGTGKLSREEFRRQKDLDAARKAGTAPAARDEEGHAINPHIPGA
jgi:hypothetical protein